MNANKPNTTTSPQRPRSVSDYFCAEDSNGRFRSYMEDRNLRLTVGWKCVDKFAGFARQGYFAVFDGHGGEQVAEYCAGRLHEVLLKTLKKDLWKGLEQFLDESFIKIDKEVSSLDAGSAGTTACVALVTVESRQRVLYIANVGDTRAVLVSSQGTERVSYDHRAVDGEEADRIKYLPALSSRKLGGFMFCGRVGAQLAITRAIGDHNLKRDGVTAKPTIRRILIRPSDKWLVVATDGVWDWFEEKDLLTVTSKEAATAQSIAKEIVRTALEQGSKDNITCLVIKL